MGQRVVENKIKIVFFDEAVAFGGSVVVLAHLFKYIDRTKFTPLLVTSLDEASISKLFAPQDLLCWFRPALSYADRDRWMARCSASSLLAKRLWAYLFSFCAFFGNLPGHIRLYYKFWRAQPSIVHFNNGTEALVAARMFKVPLVIQLHGISLELLSYAADPRTRVAQIVSISKYITAEAIKNGITADRILDIPNPAPMFSGSSVSSQQWRERFGLPANAIVVAHVGRVLRWKGQLEFLEAFARIASACPTAYALIVGDDVEGLSSEYPLALKQLVADRGIGSQVVFSGHIDNIMELMAFADIVVHSSIEPEPFGLVITEAMTAGAAVIAARLGAPIELIDDGITGLLVDPKNTDEFAQALSTLIKDEPLRKRIAVQGQRDAVEKYSPESFARKFEKVYLQAASAR